MFVPFTFLHAADLHLDSPFRGLTNVPPAVRERLKESTFVSFARLVRLARQEKVDFVVLSGDLYDAADRSLRAQLRMQRLLAELREDGIPVFIVHGNHDPENGWQARLDWPDNVRVFGSSEVEAAPVYGRDGRLAAHVYGISFPQGNVTDNLAARFRIRPGAPFHLAVLHANVDGDVRHDNYAPCRLAELASGDFHYWALGHVHDRRIVREYPHVVYPGNAQGRSIRETGPKGGYLVEVAADGRIGLSFRDTADVIWSERTVSIEGMEREQQLRDALVGAAEEAKAEAGGRAAVLRIRLEGQGPLHDRLQREAVAVEWLAELREWCGSPDESDDWVWADSLLVRTREEAAAISPDEDGFLAELQRLALEVSGDSERARALLEEAIEPALRQPKLREWNGRLTDSQREDLIRRAAGLASWLLGGREGR
ncbi:metallophosphoesterase family protein [Cohnella zeiphila]|uniref:DNA repair exonuclease n=1 Tax=Cohnella zeiphila TaxID=2761120 RepID=A0A7X0VT22_9BACL|nr:DNA repair exonuclease [Cohnella zeiphila]MBB6729414.1 DNA repair exonuclease [Cohnella zeiphila]